MTWFKRLIMGLVSVSPIWAMAGELEGMWKFDSAAQFKVDFKAPEPKVKTIIFQAPGTVVNGNCRVNLTTKEFAFDETFQPLYKQGLTEPQLQKFLKQTFNFTLSNKKQIHAVVGTRAECASPLYEFFIEGNQLLVPVGGNFFYRYLKVAAPALGNTAAGGAIAAELAALKTSRMPVKLEAYYTDCTPKLQMKGGVLKGADRCAPAYHPYIASPSTQSPLLKLIGNHDFSKTGGQYAYEYGPPFKFKRTPTFLVLPPRQGVYVIRVDDLESNDNEERDVFSGAFISVKDGVIVDQLDEGCSFDADYVCKDEHGAKIARLSDSGKFIERRAQ